MEIESDHLFRQQYGRMVASLTRIFGARRMQLAEDVVQDALVKALELWPFQGVPENPPAWLLRVAKNRALDAIRREASLAQKTPELVRTFQECGSLPNQFIDDQLAMIFLCCHPRLARETRIALTLKAVAGFSVPEIARAFLAQEPAIAQRLVRGKRQIRDEAIAFEMPEAGELRARLDSALEVVDLIFNEGYAAHEGEALVRSDLCDEAVRLARLIAGHPATDSPKSHALLALLLLQASRLPARVNADGDLFLLQDQDRTKWDQRLISEGMQHLERSSEGAEVSTYHLQAGIAAEHAAVSSFEETDWPHVTELYDSLYALDPSPVVAFNRAIALSRDQGPRAGLEALEAIQNDPALRRYHLLPAAIAEFWNELGDREAAARCYRLALECHCTEPERRFLAKRLARL